MIRKRLYFLGRLGVIALVLALTLPLMTAQAGTADAQTVTVTPTVNLRIRSGPGTNFAQVGLIPAGATVPALGRNEASNWVFIEYDGTRGWVAAWYTNIGGSLASVPVTSEEGVASPAQDTGVRATTTVNLRIRRGPGTNFEFIALAPQGSVLPVLSRTADSSWLYIDRNGTRGWVAGWYTNVAGDLNVVPVAGSDQPAAPPSAPPQQPPAQGGVTATTAVNLNMRQGPGTNHPVLGWVPVGERVAVLGRNADNSWIFGEYNGKQGWMAGWYLNVSGDLNSVPVTSGGAPTQPVAPPPSGGTGGFALGGQVQGMYHPDLMRSAGMTWAKYQHKWTPGQDPSVVAGMINEAHAHGFRVLISVTGPLYPSSIDFNSYTEFLRGVALLGADAIEVWNEMNLNREWPSGQVNPASYVNNMLAPAYAKIKAANPNTLVIAGALAPTGVNIGNDIMSDDRYLAGMRDAGAARYMDCLGVHHNAGATSPDATTGHPAAPGGGHYSWYFDPTFNLYAGTFPNTPLCYTELGYLSGDGYGAIPANFSWARDTSVSEHAQWLGRAVQKLRQSGRVRLAIIFNVDFTHWSDDPQAGYAILRPDGSCPACGPLANAVR